ncbi:MAG TPA: TMEM175 family protein [Ktedonobacterales bacterium]|nr:TMEM175 family protein [Ktedonobacterales bacterium]
MTAPERADATSAERQEDIKETGRLEAFSDGVFAIAITLLVLNIQVPAHLDSGWAKDWGQVKSLWPQYLAYVLSFVTILIMWVNHHLVFRLIHRTNQLFLMLNGLLLMCITFLNFPTALLAASLQHGNTTVATLTYNGTLIVISVFFNLVWRYATYHDRLLDAHADRALVRTIHRQYRLGPLYYGVPFVVALVSPALSIGLDLALAVYFSLTGVVRLTRDTEPADAPLLPR